MKQHYSFLSNLHVYLPNCSKGRLLCLLILALPLFSFAQEGVKASLSVAPPSREQLFADIRQWQDSLTSMPVLEMDSAALETALDSLMRQPLEPEELARKADSLAQAYSIHQDRLAKWKEAEARFHKQIEQAKAELTKGLSPEEAEKVLGRLEQASGIGEKGALSKAPAELEGVAKARALKAAGDHFAGHEAKLNKARAEMDKYKRRFDNMEGLKDKPKGFLRLNPLKGRPLPERIILGTHWQFGNQERFVIDLGPYAAWRFTDLFSAGAGFQYRLSASIEEKPWVSASDKVLGFFAFTDVDVYKGFFGRLHYERLNAPVPTMDAAGKVEKVGQEWVPGLSVGVGKSYTFYKGIKGYGLMQYNLLHEHNKTPYLHPLQAKIGFYLFGSNLQRKITK